RRRKSVIPAVKNHAAIAGVRRTKTTRKARRKGAGPYDGRFRRRTINYRAARQRRAGADPCTQCQKKEEHWPAAPTAAVAATVIAGSRMHRQHMLLRC